LTSLTGVAQTFNIGFLINNVLFWTTVSAAVISNPISITVGLPAAAPVGTLVYVYQSAIDRPLRILDGRRFYLNSSIDTPMIAYSRIDYREQPNKTATGTITQWFYDPQLVTGQLWLWPSPSDSTSAFKFTWMRTLQDFVNSTDTADFPQEWMNCIVWNLAQDLAPEYDVDPNRMKIIALRAQAAMERVMGWDKEPESIYFGVNFDQTTR
jgi:hypothetical protein